jgi:hypothetical protein
MKYVVVLLFLAGCSAAPQPAEEKKTEKLSSTVAGSVRVYTDPETKCEYLMLINPNGVAITPRLNVHSKIIC